MLLWALCLVYAAAPAADSHSRLNHYLDMPIEALMDLPVSISVHREARLRVAPSSVTLITADDIEATGAVNLAEVLRTVPGLQIRHSQFGFRPLIHFRGASDKQTLLMLNGNPISDLMWRLGIFWKGLPASMIERVEIIRGPGSALFGTDASAGVINVITKTANAIQGSRIAARAGGFGTRNLWLQQGGDWQGLDYAVTVDLLQTDGHDPWIAADGQTGRDLRSGSSASLAPGRAAYGWRGTDLRFSLADADWRLHLDFMRHTDLQIGLTGASVLDDRTEASDTRISVDWEYAQQEVRRHWDLGARVHLRHIEYDSGNGFYERPAGYLDAGGSYADGVINQMASAERGLSGELSGVYHGFQGRVLTVGTGFRWQDLYRVDHRVNSGVDATGTALPAGGSLVDISGSPFAFAPIRSRMIRYLYLQDMVAIGDNLQLTTGLRYDHHSDFGGALNPRIGLVWESGEGLTAKMMYAEAFRAPYFQELYAETSFTLPNSGLKPEGSATLEFSLGYSPNADLYIGANLWHMEQRDLIVAQMQAGQSQGRYENSGRHAIRGIELEARWQPVARLRLAGNYSFQRPDDDAHRQWHLARQQAYIRADMDLDSDWKLNLQANWIGERERVPNDPRPALDDDLVVDATLHYLGARHSRLTLGIRNLFDADARDPGSLALPQDLPLPGRSAFVEWQYTFDAPSR